MLALALRSSSVGCAADDLAYSLLKLLVCDPNESKLMRYQPIVSDINLLEESLLGDDELRRKTAAFQERLANAGSLDNQRPILDEILQELRWSVKRASVCWACAISMFS